LLARHPAALLNGALLYFVALETCFLFLARIKKTSYFRLITTQAELRGRLNKVFTLCCNDNKKQRNQD